LALTDIAYRKIKITKEQCGGCSREIRDPLSFSESSEIVDKNRIEPYCLLNPKLRYEGYFETMKFQSCGSNNCVQKDFIAVFRIQR
jgi:hypothetical protein